MALLLPQCARFGFETLSLVDETPIQVYSPGPVDPLPGPLVPSDPTCSDGVQNQDESNVDCGGPCPVCPIDAGPIPSCSDGIQNQDETAADCGGVCPACAVVAGPTCSDGTRNQDETGVDCGGAICPSCIPTACNQVVADSVADFSGTQGGRGWYYGYYSEPVLRSSGFIELPIYEYVAPLDQEIWRYGDQAWTHVGARVMHPNGRFTTGGKLAVDQFAVRRWISTTRETLLATGTIQTTGSSPNGVVGRILVGDTEVWQQFVGPSPSAPLPFEALVDVQVGDAVNFVLEPFESSDNSDATDFVVQLCR